MRSVPTPLLWTLMLWVLAGCVSPAGHDDHGDEHGHDDHGGGDHGGGDHGDDHGHGHGGHEGASEAVTRWGARTQLFVEFPALVIAEPSPFAAHLTRLSDHFAIDSGTVTVELSGGGQPTESFQVTSPSVAGIFRPIVKPAHHGPRRLTLRLESATVSESHDLGEFTVFETRAAADAAAGEEADDGGSISFLLEQQWRVPFGVQEIKTQPMRPSVPAFATLALSPAAEATIVAPRDGRIVPAGDGFPVLGQAFGEGAVVFGVVAPPGDGADTATLDLAVKQAEIVVGTSRREVERLTPLAAQGAVSPRRLDEANSALASAEAALQSARRRRASLAQTQRVDAAREALAIPAPIAGVVAELNVSPGTWVSAGDRLGRIVDTSQLLLTVSVPEAWVPRLGTISGAWFRIEGTSEVIDLPPSALVAVGTEVDATTRTLPVHFRVENADRRLLAGMMAQAWLITDQPRDAVAVPESAVVDDAGVDIVYVQTGGESFERRPVRLGLRDGELLEVLDGVKAGEWVVSRGPYLVKLASTSTAAIGHGHAH